MTTVEQHTDVFRMPALGADMTEGRVIEWYVEPGTRVAAGDIVALIETDKADIEIEVFDPCVFDGFLVELGESVAIGTPIANISLDGPPPAEHRVPPEPPATPGDIDTPTTEPQTRRLTPRARRLVERRGLDLAQLPAEGTVTGDMILGLGSDVRREPPERQASMRNAVARLMERSWAEIPHYHVLSTIDLTEASERLDHHNSSRDVHDRIVPTALLYAAVARAARDTPRLNGWWQDGAFVQSESVDLGIIVSLRAGGIVVPTIQEADRLDAAEMMSVVRDLVERARRGKLRERDLRTASISVTNMGDLGADAVLGVIHPPQVALVGLGSPRLQPGVVDGVVVPRRLVHASVAGDHRAHDGLAASRLLNRVTHHLEDLP